MVLKVVACWDVWLVVECLPSMGKTLAFSPSIKRDDDTDDDEDYMGVMVAAALSKRPLYPHPSCPPVGETVAHGKVGWLSLEQPLDSRVGA